MGIFGRIVRNAIRNHNDLGMYGILLVIHALLIGHPLKLTAGELMLIYIPVCLVVIVVKYYIQVARKSKDKSTLNSEKQKDILDIFE